MASKLHWAKMAIAPAVGEGTTAEFNAFITIYETLPDLLPILKGSGKNIPFPKEPSTRYATTIGLTVRANDANDAYHAFNWLSEKATPEWVQLFSTDMFRLMEIKGQKAVLATLMKKDPRIKNFMTSYRDLISLT